MQNVLGFWFGAPPEYGKVHKRWFQKDAAFDEAIRARFLPLYEAVAMDGCWSAWTATARGSLALIVLLDQFPRNMFRGTARAFPSDGPALEAARKLVELGWDREMLPVERQFAYLPFEHSERLEDQLRACELTRPLNAFPETHDAHDYAVRHYEIIRRFGRFPHRNAILGRESTPEEIAFLKQPGSGF